MQDIKELKSKTVSGLFWRFGERFTAQFISLIVSIVLARILLPTDYGIVAIVTIFINLFNALVTGGLGTSLVQKKDADDIDFSTMYIASILISICLYALLYLVAPLIARIYNNQLLIIVLRVMGIKLPIAAINSIQQAYVQRNMIYKKFFFATIIGTIISAFVGIIMAIKGFGVWALVAQYLTNSTIDTIVLTYTIKWKPKLIFSIERFKKLFSYGSKVTIACFIGTIFEQLRGLLIGMKYTSEELAFNNKGEQIPSMLSNNINSTMESVLFSTISKVQEDKEKVKNAVSRLMKTSSYIIMPILFGVLGVSENFVKIVLTEKWLACVPFMKIVCIQQCFTILNTINLQAIKAIGRSDTLLNLEFIKKPIYLIIIVITMFISPIAMCIGSAVYALIALLINSKPNKKNLNYTLKEQISDTAIYFIISFIMSIIVTLIGNINLNIYIVFILQILGGIVFYIMASILLKLESFYYILKIIKELLLKKKKVEEHSI